MVQLLRPQSVVDPALKARALEEVISSSTFSRSEQLRRFLRYVGEMEISGRGAGITEYSIGVEGLGRSPSFVPSDDGIVRNRAHALRQKLLEYYTRENPRAEIVIDLPRGSYMPRFHSPAAAEPELSPIVEDPAKTTGVSPIKAFLLGFAAAAVIAVLAGLLLRTKAGPAELDPIVREAWGPLAEADADATLVLSYPYHLIFREFPAGSQPGNSLFDAPAPPDIAALYRDRTPVAKGSVHLQFASATRLGEVLGLVSALKILHASGSAYQVVHDRAVSLTSMRDRNVVAFGDPNMTPMVASYLAKGFYSIRYSEEARDFVISQQGRGGRVATPRYQASPRKASDLREFPGLLTVLPSDGSNGRKRTVIFAGANSSGAQAAAEFFSSPAALRSLKDRFAKEGVKGFPNAYQVVLKGMAEGQSVLSYSYQEHHVLAR